MLVSLKEARRIERRIQEKHINNGSSLRANLNVYTKTPLKDISAATENTKNSIYNLIALTEARANIRRLIQLTNESSSINSLISNREQYIRILGSWQNVVDVEKDIRDETIISRNLKAKLVRVESGKDDYYSSQVDTVDFVAVTPELHAEAVKEVRNIQAKIDNCDDELSSLNATTKIDISDEIVKLLQHNNII